MGLPWQSTLPSAVIRCIPCRPLRTSKIKQIYIYVLAGLSIGGAHIFYSLLNGTFKFSALPIRPSILLRLSISPVVSGPNIQPLLL